MGYIRTFNCPDLGALEIVDLGLQPQPYNVLAICYNNLGTQIKPIAKASSVIVLL